jgi:hypothetical protein
MALTISKPSVTPREILFSRAIPPFFGSVSSPYASGSVSVEVGAKKCTKISLSCDQSLYIQGSRAGVALALGAFSENFAMSAQL